MPEIKEIIWDADNTIWNWVRYAAKAYPAMARVIAEETGIAEEDVIAGMKAYYTAVGTMESPWLIQGLEKMGFFRRAPKKPVDLKYLRQSAMRVFQHARAKNFKKYEGVSEIMELAHRQGIKNRILTDAPRTQAVMRLKRSRLDPYISSIHAVKTHEIITQIPPEIEWAQKNGKYDIDCEVEELELEKPDTRLEHILKIVAETHDKARKYIQDHVAIVGDNDLKDMELARRYGCLGIHALWGQPDPHDLEILSRFAPEKIAQRNLSVPNGKNGMKKSNSGKIIPIESRRELREKLIQILGLAA